MEEGYEMVRYFVWYIGIIIGVEWFLVDSVNDVIRVWWSFFCLRLLDSVKGIKLLVLVNLKLLGKVG